jgi:hypothetical protein
LLKCHDWRLLTQPTSGLAKLESGHKVSGRESTESDSTAPLAPANEID